MSTEEESKKPETEMGLDLDLHFLPAWAQKSATENKYETYTGTEGEGRERRGGAGILAVAVRVVRGVIVRVRKVAVLAARVDLVAASEVPVGRAAASVSKVGQGVKAGRVVVVVIAAVGRVIKDADVGLAVRERIVRRSSCPSWR